MPRSSLSTEEPQAAKGKIRSLTKLRFYLKPYRMRIVFALISLAVSSSIVLGLGNALKYLIDDGIEKYDVRLLDRSSACELKSAMRPCVARDSLRT